MVTTEKRAGYRASSAVAEIYPAATTIPMAESTASRTVTSSLLRGVATLLAIVAAVSFFFGGRALQDFDSFGRMSGEVVGIVCALVLGAISFLLKALAHRVEEAGNGRPVSLANNGSKENQKPE